MSDAVRTVAVWDGEPLEWNPSNTGPRPRMELFLLPGDTARGLVLVCPGGGYNGLADHEGRPVAQAFNGFGYHAAVLYYRTQYHNAPRPLGKGPLADVQRAIRILRANAEGWRINPRQIAVLGFSAGGHLAGSVGVHYDHGDPQASDPVERQSCRPDAMILCYAVLSSSGFGHSGSIQNLCGPDDPRELRGYFSPELHVTAQTPPAFLWHTAEDPGVSVQNSLAMASALSANQVPFELHVFPKGRHGLGLGQGQHGLEQWPKLCAVWLSGLGFA